MNAHATYGSIVVVAVPCQRSFLQSPIVAVLISSLAVTCFKTLFQTHTKIKINGATTTQSKQCFAGHLVDQSEFYRRVQQGNSSNAVSGGIDFFSWVDHFSANGCIVKQITHKHGCATTSQNTVVALVLGSLGGVGKLGSGLVRCIASLHCYQRFAVLHVAATKLFGPGQRTATTSGDDLAGRDLGDGGHGLSSETKGAGLRHVVQFRKSVALAGRPRLAEERHAGGVNTCAVVFASDGIGGRVDPHGNFGGTRIDRVQDKLFDRLGMGSDGDGRT
jgi:hypothetical protein